MSAVLLDTHALIWLMEAAAMSAQAKSAVERAQSDHSLLVSPVTGWEVGLLEQSGRYRFSPTAQAWLADALSLPGIRVLALTPEAAEASSRLPGALHRDPADRLLAAQARAADVALVTRDALLLSYAEAGHIRAIAC